MNETVSVVTTKTSEIGQKTWGLVKGVMALASQKMEDLSKERGLSWRSKGYQRNEDGLLSNEMGRGGYEVDNEIWGQNNKYTGSIHWDSWDQCHANKSNKKEAYVNESSQSMHNKWDDWDELHVSKPGTGGETVTVSHTSTATGGMDNWAEWDNLNNKRIF